MQRLSQDEVFVQDEVSYSFIGIVILCGRIILRQPVFVQSYKISDCVNNTFVIQ